MSNKRTIEMDNYNGTLVTIESTDKVMANRLELAIEHIFKEFANKDTHCQDGDARNG